MTSGGAGYGSNKIIFFMICTLHVFKRHLWAQILQEIWPSLHETLLRLIVLLVMKCLKQTLAHPLYCYSCIPVEGKIILVCVYVDMFLFIFNMHVIALHCCVVFLKFLKLEIVKFANLWFKFHVGYCINFYFRAIFSFSISSWHCLQFYCEVFLDCCSRWILKIRQNPFLWLKFVRVFE